MPYCCVPYCCSNSKKEKISFHQIPVESVSRELWLKAISREGTTKGSSWVPNQYDVVCAKHFKSDDYSQGPKRIILKNGVVPSVFPEYPNYMQPPTKKRRRSLNRNVQEHSTINVTINDPDLSLQNDAEINENLPSTSTVLSKPTCSLQPSNFDLEKENTLLKQKIKNLMSNLSKNKRKIKKLNKENKVLVKQNEELMSKISDISDIEKEVVDRSEHAIFIMDQIKSRKKKFFRWSPEVIKLCILWHRCSPAAYRFVRTSKCINLPCETTLKKYIGYGTAETGFGSLIKQRLVLEKDKLNEKELYGSLIIDEMSIKPMLNYDRDRIFGFVEMGGIESEIGMEDKLAKHLLCFMISGLSTRIRIPVAFYFTLQLQGTDLCTLTKYVLKEVEAIGFKICRIVTDNHSVNTCMFKELCNGAITPYIVHPEDSTRKLFLSYDYCHIIKNIRNQFLSNKKRFTNKGNQISPTYLFKLYSMQTDAIIKPVRFLTRKHLHPSSFQKMNVKRAIDIFRPEVTSASKYLQKNGQQNGLKDFDNAGPTIDFVDMVFKWFTLHNVHNCNHHIHKNQSDSMHFFELDDPRIDWLENDFLDYLKNWQAECTDEKLQFFSKETYEATVLTTKSTVECIKYLLQKGFHYVLTRKFSSDGIEAFFAYIRRLGGCNDMTNATAASDGITKVLKVGISKARNQLTAPAKELIDSKNFEQNVSYYESLLSKDLEKLEMMQASPQNCMKAATFTVIAGYLARTVEENITCSGCYGLLITPQTNSPNSDIIAKLDKGGLKYPKPQFTQLLIALDCSLKYLFSVERIDKDVMKISTAIFLSPIMKNPLFSCPLNREDNHKTILCTLILRKFLRPYISNFCKKSPDDYNCKEKEKSRKKLKVN